MAQDCFITDKKSSLYLLCGHKESAQIVGNLQLEIKPVKIISDYLQIFTDMFRFKVKGYKNKKNTIEIEMTKPDMKEFTSIQQLKLLMKLNQQNIEIKYCFKLKKMSFDKSNPLKAEDVTLELPQTLTPANYKIYGEALNQAGITKCIDEILAQVRVKSFV